MASAATSQDDVNSGSPMDSGSNPWADASPYHLLDPTDPQSQAALKGYGIGVATGQLDPVDGLNRLKKAGILHPDTQVSDLLPAQAQKQFVGPPAPSSTPTDQSNISDRTSMSQSAPINPWTMQQSAPAVVSLSGSKDSDANQNKWSSTSNQFQLPPADVLRAKMLLAQGITPGIAKDDQGQDKYQQKTNAIGQPIFEDLDGNPTTQAYEMDPKTGEKVPHTPIYDTNKPVYDFNNNETDPRHPVQQQLAGVDRMQNLLNMTAGMKANAPISSSIDLTPAMRLGEIMTGTKGDVESYQKSANMPESTAQLQARFMNAQQGIQKDRSDIQKGIYENMKTMGGGTTSDMLSAMQSSQAQQSLQDAINRAGQGKDQQDWRTAQMINARNIQGLKQDPNIGKQVMSLNSMKNAFDLLTQQPTPQTFHDAQQAVRNVSTGLTGGSKSGVEERAQTYMPSIERDFQNIQQAFGNNVQKIPANDPQMVQLKKDLQLLHEGVSQEMFKQAVARTGGFNYIYEDPRFGPQLKAGLNDLLQGYGGGPGGAPQTPLNMAAPSVGMNKAAIKKSGALPSGPNPALPGAVPQQGGTAATTPKPTPTGTVRVIELKTGLHGVIPLSEYDPKIYKKE